jgi:hypothetical protein
MTAEGIGWEPGCFSQQPCDLARADPEHRPTDNN